MRAVSRIAAAFAALAVGVLLAGCGGGGDEPEEGGTPEETAQIFVDAVADEDSEALCSTLTTEAQEQAAVEEDFESCEAAFDDAFESGIYEEEFGRAADAEIGEATIDGETATVTITAEGEEPSEAPLVMEDGVWKVELE